MTSATRRTRLPYLVLVFGLCQVQPADSQWFPERSEECGAHICLETGTSNWRSEASNYCEEDVCLRDSLESLADIGWRRFGTGGDFLGEDGDPFIGLTDAEYQTLRTLGSTDTEERVRLLAKVQVSCRLSHFALDLSLPGRKSASVPFATPPAENGGYQGFQVIRVDRRYRIGTSRTGAWMRWIHYRFPGIDRIDGSPTEFASYEMGLYVGSVVLFDKEFRVGQPEDYGKHPDCEAS